MFRHILLCVSAMCFLQSVTGQTGIRPYVPPAKTSGKVRFYNTGNRPVKLYRTTNDNAQTFISEIAANSGIDADANLREGFTVDINDDKVTDRKLYIVDLDQTVFITGNVAMKDFAGYGSSFPRLNYDPNLVGVDTTVVNTRNLVTTINKGQIFERLNDVKGIDYESQPPYLIKTGFTYAGMNLSVSTNKARMAYGYSSYASGWNIAASGKFPAGKSPVDISGNFGYGETQSSQSSTTDVYAYMRQQTITHQMAVTPSKAYLDPVFADRVRRIKDAAGADQLIRDYGTHFSEVIYYGGDISSYLRMTSTDYTKANSTNLNLGAAVEVSTPTKKEQKGYTKETTQGSTYGGKMDFSMYTDQTQRSLLEKSESQVRVIGGVYASNGYDVNEGNSVPLEVILRRIDELIQPTVFKDDTDPAQLFLARQLVQQAINRYIRSKVSAKPALQLPPPQEYVVTLTKMAVTGHMDDANANTKGNVTASVYTDNALKNKVLSPGEYLWNQGGYSLDFRFLPNSSKDMQSKLYFVHYPNATTGKFDPLYLNVAASIREKDDIAWAPDGANFSAGSGPIDLSALNLQPGGPAATRSLDMSSGGNGSIRLTYAIQKEESMFDLPSSMNTWNTNASNQTIVTPANTLANEAELTLINGGGYSAKFMVSYTVEGQAKSYDSGDVALGWRYKLALPPNAQNVRVQGYYYNVGWKPIFDKTEPKAVDKCYKVYGTIFDAKSHNSCD